MLPCARRGCINRQQENVSPATIHTDNSIVHTLLRNSLHSATKPGCEPPQASCLHNADREYREEHEACSPRS